MNTNDESDDDAFSRASQEKSSGSANDSKKMKDKRLGEDPDKLLTAIKLIEEIHPLQRKI